MTDFNSSAGREEGKKTAGRVDFRRRKSSVEKTTWVAIN